MTLKIYHNPRCSKSRSALELLEQDGRDFEVIKYLEQTPSKEELRKVVAMLGIKPIELVRTKEKLFSELGLSKDEAKSDNEWLAILAKHPKLIERPIVVDGKRAVIGRPPERVLEIL